MSTNYRNDFFQYEHLTSITEEPTFESLTRLKNELKANALSVPSTLGGGNHGMLGMVLTPAEFALVSNTPFVRQQYPGPLNFPTGTTAIQSKVLEDAYKKRLKNYELVQGVEKALIQQMVRAIAEEWLQPLRNTTTNELQGEVPDVLTYLFTTHGDVNPESLIKREDEVKRMSYDPSREPIDTVFTAVVKLVDFAAPAGAPYTRPQIINIAYLIIKRQRVFNQAIIDWNKDVRANPNRSTWVNFKRHFRSAYKDLKEVEELRVAETPFSQANLVSQIVDAVQESLAAPEEAPAQASPTLLHANIASQTQPPDATAALVQQMMLMNANLMNNMPPSNGNGGRGGRGYGRGYRNTGRGGRGNGRGRRIRTMRYCWTCGWGTHDGEHCRVPATGHNADATITNQMGGCTDGFPPGYTS